MISNPMSALAVALACLLALAYASEGEGPRTIGLLLGEEAQAAASAAAAATSVFAGLAGLAGLASRPFGSYGVGSPWYRPGAGLFPPQYAPGYGYNGYNGYSPYASGYAPGFSPYNPYVPFPVTQQLGFVR